VFDDLDQVEKISDENHSARLITNMPINEEFFREHGDFFASVGYIAFQVAQIEDEIKQSMIQITMDPDAVLDQTKSKNLGALLSLYELVFLAKFGGERQLKEWFYAVKFFVERANKYRNEAVHKNWAFLEADPDRPCFEIVEGGVSKFAVVSPGLMKKRASFLHEVFKLVNDLRAVTEDPEYWSPEGIADARKNLDRIQEHLEKKRTRKN
jgi:hypothetical protein